MDRGFIHLAKGNGSPSTTWRTVRPPFPMTNLLGFLICLVLFFDVPVPIIIEGLELNDDDRVIMEEVGQRAKTAEVG